MPLPTYLGINESKELVKRSFAQFKAVGPGKYTPLCLWGEKGIGKTTIIKQAVQELREELSKKAGREVSIRLTILKLGAMQPFTINGYPPIVEVTIDGKKFETQKHATPTFLIDSHGYDYHVVFVDEINRARPEMHNAIMGLLDGDGINEHEIPSNMFLVAAANPPSENYSNTTDMDDAALVDRTYHINVATKVDETLKYMFDDKTIDDVIYNYLKEDETRIQVKSEFEPTTKHIIPSDRSFSVVGRFLPYVKDNLLLLEATAKGLLGDVIGDQFVGRLREFEAIFSPLEILNEFNKAKSDTIKSFVNGGEEGVGRLDSVARLCDTIVLYLGNESRKELTKKQLGNLKKFLALIPHDIKENVFTKGEFKEKEAKFFELESKEVLETEGQSFDELEWR